MTQPTPTADAALDGVLLERVLREVGRRVVGQEMMIERLLIGLLTGGHILLEGVPGLAKTLAVRTLAEVVHLTFSRIQFTPDLLPADLIGTMVYDQKTQDFHVRRGPIFAQIVLADEINRAPAKVQSALLEAMQEKQVTIGGETYALLEPFLVLATQNPLESEGTYTLPEAQLDRFMLKVHVDYPTRAEEKEVLLRLGGGEDIPVERLLTPEAILRTRRRIAGLYADQKVVDYIVDLVRSTRDPGAVGRTDLRALVGFGASPRASLSLLAASRAHAFLRGRDYVIPEDVRALAPDVLRHRVILTFEAEAEDVTSDAVIGRLLETVKAP
jgi:MoxR-like ATPase